jgi:uncharacterized protein (DUF885 family)
LREKTAQSAYCNGPALDGSLPEIFFSNLRKTEEVARFGMRTLAYREAIHGQSFPIAIQRSLTGVSTFLKLLPFTACAEGWALYIERLVWEEGFPEKPLDNLGRLQLGMFRAECLIVDTGLHHKRWNREQAIHAAGQIKLAPAALPKPKCITGPCRCTPPAPST